MAVNPSADALRTQFGGAIERVATSNGHTIVYMVPARVREVLGWLKERPEQDYNYLVDVTAVEYRDHERPIEVVYIVRSLNRGVDLTLKAELPKNQPLEVESIVSLWRAADWLEREVYDMFGIRFANHPDLRRILMWETYQEGYPLRKDFPLRGRFSRSEQTRQALHANPEAHYSLEELTIAEAHHDLPQDMRERIARGERDRIPDLPEEPA